MNRSLWFLLVKVMKVLNLGVLLLALNLFCNAQNAILTGAVYDHNGSRIANAKITAIDTYGMKYKAITDETGVYSLELPYIVRKPVVTNGLIRYDVAVTAAGFKRSITKSFAFVSGSDGKMHLDIALEVAGVVTDKSGFFVNKKRAKREVH